jgi:methylenetetrahydrofolate dehydrogenase (NADP+)/methenyltetrahydrofolate cyclohydrolase
MLLLAHYGIALAGCNAVVIGRSNLVGKPLALLLLQEGATVTCCHSATRDLAEHTRRADILVSAAGRANLVNAGMVKPGAVVVDVGINYVPAPDADLGEGGGLLLCGDVAYSEVEPLADWISPVPGGVGPMTIASVLWNGLELYKAGTQ